MNLNVSPSQNSGLASGSSTLSTTTTSPTGYKLSIIATSTGTKLTPSSGTIASPVALSNNTWGYALTKASAVGVTNNFDSSYSSPNTASKWANPTTATVIQRSYDRCH
jgi:uncharacterized membrane protein